MREAGKKQRWIYFWKKLIMANKKSLNELLKQNGRN